MKLERKQRLLSLSCVIALVALALFMWSLLDPRPLPIIVAMSVGQVLGTLSLAIFVVVAARDYLRTMRVGDAHPSVPPKKP
jgi:hypothetical protein